MASADECLDGYVSHDYQYMTRNYVLRNRYKHNLQSEYINQTRLHETIAAALRQYEYHLPRPRSGANCSKTQSLKDVSVSFLVMRVSVKIQIKLAMDRIGILYPGMQTACNTNI